MGRIEEAMRRAAEGSGPASPTQSAAALAGEPFPEEPGQSAAAATAALVEEPVERPTVDAAIHAGPPTVDRRDAAAAPAYHFNRDLSAKLVVDQAIIPASREQYRRLAATLVHGQAAHDLKVVMVTSATVAEGKSLTATNLALTFSESYHRPTLLIDADLRRPSLHRNFSVDGAVGLNDALMSAEDQPLRLHQVTSRLTVVAAGRPSNDPMAGLSSVRMRRVLEEARRAFEWVIIDTPPVGLLSDASLLSAMVDGVVLVVKAGATPYDLVQRAIDAVGRDRILGVVLNRAAPDPRGSYYSYGHYYGAESPKA